MFHALLRALLIALPATAGSSYYLPGDRVIWREDFEQDAIGEFPARMGLERGDFGVAEIDGRRYLRTVEGGIVTISLPEVLPPLFSIEIEYRSPQNSGPVRIETNTSARGGHDCQLGSFLRAAFVECRGMRTLAKSEIPHGGFTHLRFTVDGEHISAYINEDRLPKLPNARIPRSRRIRLRIPGATEAEPLVISEIRIAEGGRKR